MFYGLAVGLCTNVDTWVQGHTGNMAASLAYREESGPIQHLFCLTAQTHAVTKNTLVILPAGFFTTNVYLCS